MVLRKLHVWSAPRHLGPETGQRQRWGGQQIRRARVGPSHIISILQGHVHVPENLVNVVWGAEVSICAKAAFSVCDGDHAVT